MITKYRLIYLAEGRCLMCREAVKNTFLGLLLGMALGLMCAAPLYAASYSPTVTTNDINNPHKGFMLWGTDYARGAQDNYYGTTIYHLYMSWREVEIADQLFDWGRFETNHLLPILADRPDATFVLRPVVDYPDGENNGITLFYTGDELQRDFPRFLIEPPLSISYYPYASCNGDGPGWTPDWNHPAMITQLVQFVQAFAQRYDGDPRITAVQVGLLGLWGEWHQSGCDEHAPSNDVKEAVRDAYAAAFTNTPLQTRYARNPDAVGVEFGFYEDYFPSFTASCIYGFPVCSDDGDWNLHYCYLYVTPASADNWRSNPISGESPMASQKLAWSNDSDDVMTVLRDYHFSFLGPAGGHEWIGNQAKLNPMKRLLGYNYHIVSVDWPVAAHLDHAFPVTLVLTNTGAAPSYHRFPVEVALCDSNGVAQWRGAYTFDLRDLTPDMAFSKTESFTVANLAPGVYSLRIGILDQRTGEPGIRIQSAGEDLQWRIVIGDIELQDPWVSDSDGDHIPDGWEFQYSGDFTNAVPGADPDNDGFTVWQEYIADTDPTNPASFFPRITLTLAGTNFLLGLDPTSTARLYYVDMRTNLLAPDWQPATNIPGIGGPWKLEHPAQDAPAMFFRGRVTLP